MANEYVTVAELKAALGITRTDQDTSVQMAAEAASRYVDRRTGRRFYPDPDATQVRRYMPVSPNYLLIDDLLTFTSLSDAYGSWTLDSDFYLQPDNAPAQGRPWDTIRAIGGAGWGWPEAWQEASAPAGRRFVRGQRLTVTGQFGWQAPPADVKQATMILAEQYYYRPKQAVFAVVGVGFEGEGMRLPQADPHADSLLAPYVRSSMIE